MQLPQPQSQTFSNLIGQIENGQIKIPQFQRDFVWTMQKSAGLVDSIVKGYPIGTFIFWKTKERLRSIRNLGDYALPETPEGESVYFVLDGQQRLTSLFACLKGVKVSRDKKEDDFSKIYIDLDADESQPIVITDISEKEDKTFISILDLMSGGMGLARIFPEKYWEKIGVYQERINSYQYSIVQLEDASLDVATEVFTRINVGGTPLTVFEIMVAKTFDEKRNFDLSEKYQQLIEELETINYETISDATVLQTISMIMVGECKRSIILKLDKQQFIDTWNNAADAIEKAAEYFRNYYRIPVSQLLPYNALIVPFAYFFSKHKDKPTTGDKQKFLEDFFWRCSLSGRYSSAVESKLAQDVKRIEKILNDELPSYDWPVDTSAEFIENNGWFSAGRSYVKGILCIYAHFQPKSFVDDSIVNISNNWLKQANSKNYHHFFPKAYLKGKEDRFYINHILNITIVDDFLNKREIGKKPPSIYMKKFKKNKNLLDTMKTHLIDDLESFGIWSDDYDKFFAARANLVSREINKRIVKQKIDKNKQLELDDDFEEDITVTE